MRIAAILLLVATLSGCQRRVPAPTVEGVQVQDGPDQETWDPKLFLSDQGKPRLHLRAEHMAYFDRGDSTYMLLSGLTPGARVHADIFDSQGDSAAVVMADRVVFFDRERRLEARGNVIVTAREGRRVESEQLEWSEFERKVTTEGFARITQPDRRLQGYGLVADEDITNVSISNLTGVVMIEDEDS